MAQTAGGTYYAASSELVSSWPATSLNLANQLESRFAAKSDIASPTFTGTPAAPTAAAGTNTTQIATTAFVLANAPASGLTLIAAQSFSAVSSVSVNNCFTAYENYRILVTNLVGTTGGDAVRMRFRASGTDSSTGYYTLGNYQGASSGNINDSNSPEVAFDSLASTGRGSIALDVGCPNLAVPTTFLGLGQRFNGGAFRGGYHSPSTAYDGLTLWPSAGTMSGTIRIYGYKNS